MRNIRFDVINILHSQVPQRHFRPLSLSLRAAVRVFYLWSIYPPFSKTTYDDDGNGKLCADEEICSKLDSFGIACASTESRRFAGSIDASGFTPMASVLWVS